MHSLEQIKSDTIDLINQASPGNGFIIGITDDVPEDRWQENFLAIMDGIDEMKYNNNQ